MRRALLVTAVALVCGLPAAVGAQNGGQAEPQPAEAAAAPTPPVRVLIAPPRHPEQARFYGAKAVDIPQWAKDAGHNGSVWYIVTVAPDGTAARLELQRSSHSKAIDDAAREYLASARFIPATDAAGNEIEGRVNVFLRYYRWDEESPGGSIDDYRCADLVRELEWFEEAHEGDERPFPPESAYVSLALLEYRNANFAIERSVAERQRALARQEWRKIVRECRREPETLLLDQLENPDGYRLVLGVL